MLVGLEVAVLTLAALLVEDVDDRGREFKVEGEFLVVEDEVRKLDDEALAVDDKDVVLAELPDEALDVDELLVKPRDEIRVELIALMVELIKELLVDVVDVGRGELIDVVEVGRVELIDVVKVGRVEMIVDVPVRAELLIRLVMLLLRLEPAEVVGRELEVLVREVEEESLELEGTVLEDVRVVLELTDVVEVELPLKNEESLEVCVVEDIPGYEELVVLRDVVDTLVRGREEMVLVILLLELLVQELLVVVDVRLELTDIVERLGPSLKREASSPLLVGEGVEDDLEVAGLVALRGVVVTLVTGREVIELEDLLLDEVLEALLELLSQVLLEVVMEVLLELGLLIARLEILLGGFTVLLFHEDEVVGRIVTDIELVELQARALVDVDIIPDVGLGWIDRKDVLVVVGVSHGLDEVGLEVEEAALQLEDIGLELITDDCGVADQDLELLLRVDVHVGDLVVLLADD